MNFTKISAGKYQAGHWTIERTHVWQLRHDGADVMGYTSLAAAKAGAAEYAQRWAIVAAEATRSRRWVARTVANAQRALEVEHAAELAQQSANLDRLMADIAAGRR